MSLDAEAYLNATAFVSLMGDPEDKTRNFNNSNNKIFTISSNLAPTAPAAAPPPPPPQLQPEQQLGGAADDTNASANGGSPPPYGQPPGYYVQSYPPPPPPLQFQKGGPPPQAVYYQTGPQSQPQPQTTIIYVVEQPPGQQNPAMTNYDSSSEMIIVRFFEDPRARRLFIQKVYSILLLQLLVCISSVAACVFIPPVKDYVTQHSYLLYFWLFLYLACVIVMCCCGPALYSTNVLSLSVLIVVTISMSLMAGFISSNYHGKVVLIALGATAAVVFLVTLFAFQSKFDFTNCLGVMCVIILIFMLFVIFAAFLSYYMPFLQVIISFAGAAIMTMYLLIHTQMLMSGKRYNLQPDSYVFAAILIFLDVVILFLYILRIVDYAK